MSTSHYTFNFKQARYEMIFDLKLEGGPICYKNDGWSIQQLKNNVVYTIMALKHNSIMYRTMAMNLFPGTRLL